MEIMFIGVAERMSTISSIPIIFFVAFGREVAVCGSILTLFMSVVVVIV